MHCLAGAEILHDFPDFRASEPTPRQKCDQSALPHRGGQPCKLASPLLDERSNGVREVNALGGERRAHRVLRDAAVYSLCLQVADQPCGTATAVDFGEGVILSEAHVVEQAHGTQPIERAVDGGRWMLFLEQAAPQVVTRVCAARERTERGAVRRLEIGQLLQPLEDEWPDFPADHQVEPD
jgi:hypothetical protein